MHNIIIRVIEQPRRYWAKFLLNFSFLMSDKTYLKELYLYTNGKPLDLDNPQTFCEKLNWLKLYDRNPLYTMMVDKYEVKKYVADKIGAEYVIPTLGVWSEPGEIDWNSLPNQFVLKTTHGGAGNGVIICKDKRTIDRKSIEKQLQQSLVNDLYNRFREWPYKNVRKRVFAEQFINSDRQKESSDLVDYKFYCFKGEPMYCQVIRDRSTQETIDFYDMNWSHMPFVGLNPKCKNGMTPVLRPKCFGDMIRVCQILSKNIPFARIDLYEVAEKMYFGEITFYPSAGLGTFSPGDWNITLGNMIEIKK